MKWLAQLDPGQVAVLIEAKDRDEAMALAEEIAESIGWPNLKGWVHCLRRVGNYYEETEQ